MFSYINWTFKESHGVIFMNPMCGRYTLKTPEDLLAKEFDLKIITKIKPHYNIAPSQNVAVVMNTSPHELSYLKWGLIPFWSKEAGSGIINARAESVAEKPSFRKAFKSQRCLILADGFYEWKATGEKVKQPFYIHLKNNRPFAFAGIWDKWKSPEGEILETCAIVTTEPNELMKNIHNRMPVILKSSDYEKWLLSEDPKSLLSTLDASKMEAYPVSTHVNKPMNDDPQCVKAVS